MKHQTFYIIDNHYPLSITTASRIKKLLIKKGWHYDVDNHQFLFVVGGDGTLVRALTKYYEKTTNIICINTGNIGFYAMLNHLDVEKLNKLVINKSNYINPEILEIKVNNKTFYAINEVVVQALNTVEVDVEIDNTPYERFKGTGLLVSTKTGSTGQAKANNGAIIAPNVGALQLLELAPTLHANRTTIGSPMILSNNTEIKFSNFTFNQRTDLIIDGMLKAKLKNADIVSIKQIKSTFSLFFSSDINEYIKKINRTFISFV